MGLEEAIMVNTESTVLINLLIFALGVIATVIVIFVRKSTNNINKDISKLSKKGYKIEDIQYSIKILEDVVVNVIESLNQTVVDNLKAKSDDSKLTVEAASEIKNTAIERIMGILSTSVKDVIESVYGDVESYIASLIESTIYNLKLYKYKEKEK